MGSTGQWGQGREEAQMPTPQRGPEREVPGDWSKARFPQRKQAKGICRS